MPLFRAKVAVMAEEDIPVYAKSLEEARRYLETDDEWKQGDNMIVLNVEQVSDPKGLAHWADRDFLCWASEDDADEITAVEAFYDYKERDYRGLTEDQIDDLWEHEASEVDFLRAKFRQLAKKKP